MLRFFRKIRQNLLHENRIGSYLIYAVGEVMLVIIGIMIAVGLNNLNEAKAQNKKIEAILRQIQNELTATIEQSNSVIEYYRRKDSVIYVFMNNNLTKDDFKDPINWRLRQISNNYSTVDMQDDGFKNLMLKSEFLTAKYDTLTNQLKDLYINGKSRLDIFNERVGKVTTKTLEYQQENYDWFTEFNFKGNLNDDLLNYILDDKHYKNSITQYSIMAMQNLVPIVIETRINAMKYVKAIDNLLGESGLYSFDINVSDYMSWVGKYHYQGDTIQIYNNEGHLKYSNSDNKLFEIYPLTKTKFHDSSPMFFQFLKNENGEINELNIHSSNFNLAYKKVFAND